MCLLSQKPLAERADEDIIVYKIFQESDNHKKDKILYSPYTFFKYKNNKSLKKAKFNRSSYSCYKSYFKKIYRFIFFNKGYNYKESSNLYCICDGFFHSLNSVETAISRISPGENLSIYRCLIPKGSYFYKGVHDDFASRKIKILEKVV